MLRAAGRRGRTRGDARAPARGGLGDDLVRLHEDARRPRERAAPGSSATTRPRPRTCTPCAASASGCRRQERRELAARPPARGVRVRPRAGAGGARDAVRPERLQPGRGGGARDRPRARRTWSPRPSPGGWTSGRPAPARRGAADDVSGRVVVVDSRGRTLADSAGARFTGRSLRRPAGDRGRARARHGRAGPASERDARRGAAVHGRPGGRERAPRGRRAHHARHRADRGTHPARPAGRRRHRRRRHSSSASRSPGCWPGPWRVRCGTSPAAAARRSGAATWTPAPSRPAPSEQQEVARAFNDMADRLAPMVHAQHEFVANASHQLRTPLTGLRLRLEAAAAKSDDPGVARELEAAEHEAERLADLLTALLALAREGGERPAAAPIDPLLDAAEQCVRALARGGRRRGRAACWPRAPTSTRVRVAGGRRHRPRQPRGERARATRPRGRTWRSRRRPTDGPLCWRCSTAGPGSAREEAERCWSASRAGRRRGTARPEPVSASRSCARSRGGGAGTRAPSRAPVAARA